MSFFGGGRTESTFINPFFLGLALHLFSSNTVYGPENSLSNSITEALDVTSDVSSHCLGYTLVTKNGKKLK